MKAELQKDNTYHVTSPSQRSQILIADFDERRLAVGWKMAVHEAFRDALDIKFTSIQINKETVQRWTQGHLFYFKAGDTIWDAPEPFLSYSDRTGRLEKWADIVPYITFGLQIELSSPVTNGDVIVDLENEDDEIIQPGKLDTIDVKITRGSPGTVRFHLLYPDKNKKKIIKDLDPYDCTQEEFIVLLKTGLLYQKNSIEPIDFFELINKKTSAPPVQQSLLDTLTIEKI